MTPETTKKKFNTFEEKLKLNCNKLVISMPTKPTENTTKATKATKASPLILPPSSRYAE